MNCQHVEALSTERLAIRAGGLLRMFVHGLHYDLECYSVVRLMKKVTKQPLYVNPRTYSDLPQRNSGGDEAQQDLMR